MKRDKLHFIARVVAVAAVLSLAFVKPVYAKDYMARLRETLWTERLYTAVTIEELEDAKSNAANFKKNYSGRCVAIGNNTTVESISDDLKQVVLKDRQGKTCLAVPFEDREREIVGDIERGDTVTVYGKVVVDGSSYYLNATVMERRNSEFVKGDLFFFNTPVYSYVEVKDLRKDGRVKYRIPESWNNGYVISDLTNNGIKGYQYNLNAIEPMNIQYPEIFYIFYFNNETYLKQPPKDPTESNLKKIEAKIVENILEAVGGDSADSINGFYDTNNNLFHYYTTSHRAKDGRDYRLEFLFKPDQKGIVCMLYLYFPNENTVNHELEVAYLIGSMTDDTALEF
ncbi:MAG: hypothetical protein K6G60_01225 [Lachnospiraceae bacterium]|nr:hypothetical protein [Lachnospiraceae bacterium]